MWHVFRLTLKDQTGRAVRIYEVPTAGGIVPLFSPSIMGEIALVAANGGKAVIKERKY